MINNLFFKTKSFFTKSIKVFLFFLFLLIGINVWGQTYSHTIGSNTWSSNGNQTLSSVSWNLTTTGGTGYYGYDAAKGQQLGSSSNHFTSAVLKTSGISGTITSIKISSSTAANGTAKIASVSVGGTNFTPTNQSLTTSNTEYTFTGSSSGEIVITWTNTARAFYLKKIVIDYGASVTPTLTVAPTSITGLNYTQGSGPSVAQSYNVKGADLTAGITVTAPTNFEVSKTISGTYSNSITYTATEGNATSGQSVFVRLKSGLTTGTYNGSVTNFSSGATTRNVSVTGVVSAASSYTLTYNGNDQTSAVSTIPADVSFTGGQAGVILANPTTLAKTGYELSNWHSQADGSQPTIIYARGSQYSSTMPNNNITLYAQWRFRITYNNNGGVGSNFLQSGYYNGTAGTGTLTLNNGSGFTRSGYTFGGWKTTATGTTADYSPNATYTHSGASAAVTLYAHWIPNSATLNVTPSSLSGFTYSESNGPSAHQSITLSGSSLDGTDVSMVPDDHYEISIDNGNSWQDYAASPVILPSYNGATITILVRLKAGLSVGNYNNEVILIEGGGDADGAMVNLSGAVTACFAPATQSTVSTFTAVGVNGMTVNLTPGNGIGRIVKINTTNNFTDPISSNILPTANTVYSGSGEQVIYAGAGNSVSVTGLSHSTTYWIRVYEYNFCSGNYIYNNTTTPTNNPRSQITACEIPANPNGEVDADPSCGSVDLIYQHGTLQPQAGVTYYWQTTATGVSTANPTTNIYTVTTGGYYYVRAYNGNCWSTESYRINEPIVILSPVTISTHPADQSVNVGSTANFSVTASNVSSYQWQVSTNNGTTWTNVNGATNATYTTATTTLAMNNYKYRVRLSNSCGTINSNVATLSVISGPCFTENFGSNNISYTTGNVSLGSGFWYFNDASIQNTSGRFEAQLRSVTGTYISTPELSSGVKSVSFKAYRTSGTGSSLQVNYSTDGGTTWLPAIGSPFSLSTSLNTYTATINTSVPTIIKFYRTDGTVRIDDVEVICSEPACTPATITAFPTSGPANTVVTITGSDFDASSTVKFGTATAIVEYINSTELKVIVPANADGDIIVDTALDCDSETGFTLIKQDASGCETLTNGSGSGNAYATDLIFYEIYDENGGTGGTISIYNGTSAPVNLSNYSFYRNGGASGDAFTVYGSLTGIVAVGELAIIGVSGSKCGIATTNGSVNNGFNADDGFQLRKNSGNTIVDEVWAPNYAGYYLKRKPTNLSPKSTYDANDWTETSVAFEECLPGVAEETPAVKTPPPTIITQPNYTLTCEVNNTSLAITATEGYVGGLSLAYQWYVLGISGNWELVSNGGVYSGATSATLNISDVTGLNNYQYYCEVRENTATCFTATSAVQIKETNNTWTTSNLWTNGTPVLNSRVILAGNYDTQINGTLDVCELTVNAGGSLTVKPNFPIKVKKKITNLGTATDFVIESDANLLQTENVNNVGSILVKRNVKDVKNDLNLAMDYIYWSSPVSGQITKGVSGFSPGTPNNRFYEYRESNDNFYETPDLIFKTGKGYAVRAESGLPYPYTKTYTFTGVPNNGDLAYENLAHTNSDRGYNMVGNPYPSNIYFDDLATENSDKVFVEAYFWLNNVYEKNQLGGNYSGNNYSIYNGTGGTGATSSPNPDGIIKVGQGFLMHTKSGGKNQPLVFKNSMRLSDNGTGFYQKKRKKNRFWLRLFTPDNKFNTILIGYIPNATDDFENDFDAELFVIGDDSFYSTLGARKLAIQGKSNFNIDDKISLGTVHSGDGVYKIALEKPEGIFAVDQEIYLRDKLLNKYINLSDVTSYEFFAEKGIDVSRFEVVYKEILATETVIKQNLEVYKQNNHFVIKSDDKLGRIELYDTSGKLVLVKITNDSQISIDVSSLPSSVYIIKVENNGNPKTKKVIK